MKTTSENLLLIFTRNPELGKCKTRLAATIGDKRALEIYKFLLRHTAAITKNIEATKQVYYSEEIWENDIWNGQIFEKRLQHGVDLGKRMLNAFKAGFGEGYKKIIIIGSDLFAIDQQDIDQAFEQLANNDFVIGPAEDGGFYLLGMKQLKEELFFNKNWGTNTVLKNILADLHEENITLRDIRNDVDTFEDIKDVSAFQPFLKKENND